MEWILLAIFAGICNGTFAFPMKFTSKWRWENIWGLFSLWGFVVFPILLGLMTVPHLFKIFQVVGLQKLFLIFIFGFLWGIGSICFGLGIRYIGIGMAFSLNIGLTIAIGSLLPLFQGMLNSDSDQRNAMIVLFGILIIIIGVIINGHAAFLREKQISKDENISKLTKKSRKVAFKGIVLCIVAGLMSPMLQIAFMLGRDIVIVAKEMGISTTMATNAIWMVALFGGFVITIVYTTILLTRNKTWELYKITEAKNYHLYAIIMGLLWTVTIASYGIAVGNMGELGLSIGWAIFNSVGIICANLLGILTKEWQNAHKKIIYVMAGGLFFLVMGTCIVGMAQ